LKGHDSSRAATTKENGGAFSPEGNLEGLMARVAWIGILGFGLFLFVLLDLALVWYVIHSKLGARGYGSLLIPIFATWQAYLALKRRIDSEPENGSLNTEDKTEEGSKPSWQRKQ
jgi:hypothetical protein